MGKPGGQPPWSPPDFAAASCGPTLGVGSHIGNDMKLLLLAGAGGAIGSALRYLANAGFGRWLGAGFPWSTLFVNVAGSLAMGFIAELIALRFAGSPELRTFLMTGILGGFTTFSAFSLDVAALMTRGEPTLAALYVGASVAVSILALYLGMEIAKGAFA